ncbi:MAG: hypothetical protein M0Z46_21035 [Actinomycetota bacterium]|nr:hypothetical protein [Actinomycetota bacterium]
MSSSPRRWAECQPNKAVLEALDTADRPMSYQQAVAARPSDRGQWSNRFADACALVGSDALRRSLRALGASNELIVYPERGGRRERPVRLGEGSQKRVDVAVVHPYGGLRIDVTLKGMNFANYGHNLTGRTYEFEAEMQEVRRLQPACYLFAIFFVPLPGADDHVPSSFAKTVVHLRKRVRMSLVGVPRPPDRLDGAAVALYAPVDVPLSGGEVVRRGVVRCFDVGAPDAPNEPPQRGRPEVSSTVAIGGLFDRWTTRYLEEAGGGRPQWANQEVDLP